MTEVPIFAVRLLDDRSGYVIDAVWTDGRTEQIGGVLFKEPASAAQWVRESSGPWVKGRLTRASNVIEFRRRSR
jgi:hypothetical protein